MLTLHLLNKNSRSLWLVKPVDTWFYEPDLHHTSVVEVRGRWAYHTLILTFVIIDNASDVLMLLLAICVLFVIVSECYSSI